MKIESKMISHMSFTDCHILKTEYKIKKDIGALKFYSETCTEKINDFEFGESETVYYFNIEDKETFKSIKSLLESKGIEYKL